MLTTFLAAIMEVYNLQNALKNKKNEIKQEEAEAELVSDEEQQD